MQSIFGAIVLILGVLLLLKTTGIYDTGKLLLYIPSLFILLELYVFWRSDFSNITGTIILIAIFAFLQMLIIDIISWEVIANWWPLLIILIGIGILTERMRGPFTSRKDTDTVDMLAILGNMNSANSSVNFLGGNITSVLGDVKLDLRDSTIKRPPAKINVFSVLGDIDIKVPENWHIEMDVMSILGDVKNKSPRSSIRNESVAEKPSLTVTGFVVLSDISIND